MFIYDEKTKGIQIPKFVKFTVIFNFFIGFIMLLILIVMLVYQYNERKTWFSTFYFMSKDRDYSMTYEDRKKEFQLKTIGLLIEAGSDFTDIEKLEWTNYVFTRSFNMGLDPEVVVSSADIESKFKKNAIGKYGEKGVYQFKDDTAKRVCLLSNMAYYDKLLFDPMKATRLWFDYINFLLNKYQGDLNYALLAYNMGEQDLIHYSGITVDNITGVIDISTGNLEKIRKDYYYKRKRKFSYDELIFLSMKKIKDLDYCDTDNKLYDKINEILILHK